MDTNLLVVIDAAVSNQQSEKLEPEHYKNCRIGELSVEVQLEFKTNFG